MKNIYKVLQLSVEPEQLERDLNKIAGNWSLMQLIPVTKVDPGMMINGQPRIKAMFLAILTQYIDEYEDQD